jgi:hypothetical protein
MLFSMIVHLIVEFALRIYVIEQQVGSKFNRAMLMNIGYAEAIKGGCHD